MYTVGSCKDGFASGNSFHVLSRKRPGSDVAKFSTSRLAKRTARRTRASTSAPGTAIARTRACSAVAGSSRNGIVCSMLIASARRAARSTTCSRCSAATSADASSLRPIVAVTTSPGSRPNTASTSAAAAVGGGSTRQPPDARSIVAASSPHIAAGGPWSTWMYTAS